VNWLGYVQSRLREVQPASVYALDESAFELASRLLPKTPISMYVKLSNTPCSLAFGLHALDSLSAQNAQHLISHTKLYVAPRLLLVEHADGVLDAEAFRALGFTLSASDPAENLNIYDYDLDTYKSVPDWLNARFWAHPERWKP
jgi:hypothetical protein